MIYVLCGISSVYALLSMLAAIVGMKGSKQKDTHVIMLSGGGLLLAAAVTLLLRWQYDFILAILGGASICAAAFINGRRGDAFHLSHHIVRFALTVILTVGFILL